MSDSSLSKRGNRDFENTYPRHNPTNKAQVVYRTLLELTPNSDVSDGSVSATT